MRWAVFINGKDIGIIETNYRYAASYWSDRERITGHKIKLKVVDTDGQFGKVKT